MYYIGIDVGGMSIKGGIVDENGNIIVKDSVVTKPTQPSDDNAKDIAGLVAKLLEDAGISTDEIAGMGMGVPGTVDPDTAKIFYTCNIFFRDYDFRAEFKKYFDFPVYIGNDADCAVIGESVFGDMKGVQNAVMVTLGTGVGTGTIVKGNLISGFKGAGGEGGHTVIRMGGEKCGCGRRGCVSNCSYPRYQTRDGKTPRKSNERNRQKRRESHGAYGIRRDERGRQNRKSHCFKIYQIRRRRTCEYRQLYPSRNNLYGRRN